jgi:hypothetical protein
LNADMHQRRSTDRQSRWRRGGGSRTLYSCGNA